MKPDIASVPSQTSSSLPDRPEEATPAPGQPEEQKVDRRVIELRRTNRVRQRVELLSAVLLALATVATAWSGYQSAVWNSEQSNHMAAASTANIRYAKFTNLGLQKIGIHTQLFGQWAVATSGGDTALADWLFERFPEPLKTAATAWLATRPLTNPAAPATPFEMPEYSLVENAEALRWEATAAAEAEAAGTASEISDRYLLFTIIFASVLFFGGISGKFGWLAIDIATLAFGALALLIGLAILLLSPIK